MTYSQTPAAKYQRDRYKKPCVDGCGTLTWHHGGHTGRCRTCTGIRNRTAAHGTESRYVSGCRCDECRQAANAARAARRHKPNPAVHGTASSYRNGCRCDTCREAINIVVREYKRARRAELRAAKEAAAQG